MRALVFITALLLVASSLKLRHDDECVVENQWGGSHAAWNPAGTWVIGWRPSQPIHAVDISSSDNGQSYSGSITYVGEGPIGFKATRVTGNSYTV